MFVTWFTSAAQKKAGASRPRLAPNRNAVFTKNFMAYDLEKLRRGQMVKKKPSTCAPLQSRLLCSMASDAQLTPMMAQYRRIKSEMPRDALLLFPLGVFYATLFDDPKTAAELLY